MQMAINARVMLRRNTCTCDGLVNGAMGTIAGFEWPEGQRITGQQPCDINVMFDDQRVGGQTRGTADHLATTIRPATSSFSGKDDRHQFKRYQYPIVLAWAVTIHRVQGISLDQAVTDLGKDIFDHGQAYVALSSVRRLDGVLLVGLLTASFDKNKSCVHDEYARLARYPYSYFMTTAY